MRKLAFALAAAAALGLATPVVTSPASAETKVVIKNKRDHHRHWNRGHRKVVVIKNKRNDGWRHHHAHVKKKVIIKRD
jgi:hypothetical protein